MSYKVKSDQSAQLMYISDTNEYKYLSLSFISPLTVLSLSNCLDISFKGKPPYSIFSPHPLQAYHIRFRCHKINAHEWIKKLKIVEVFFPKIRFNDFLYWKYLILSHKMCRLKCMVAANLSDKFKLTKIIIPDWLSFHFISVHLI